MRGILANQNERRNILNEWYEDLFIGWRRKFGLNIRTKYGLQISVFILDNNRGFNVYV